MVSVSQYDQRRLQRRLFGIDFTLVATTVAIAILGIVMVYTATRGNLLANDDNPHYYLVRQTGFVILGLGAMFVMALIDYRRIEQFGYLIYWFCVFMLLAVLVPGVGSHTLGSQRWFALGPLQIQPSEFAVLAVIVAVATYCSRRNEGLTWGDVVRVLFLAGIPILLVMKQPDLGTALIMIITLLVMLAVAGLPGRILVILVLGAAGSVLLGVQAGFLERYQLNRLTGFLNQDNNKATGTLLQAIYNLREAKDAIGSGGVWGSGVGHGAQTNLGYVPFQQTDFIFTAVGEQLGFVGATLVLCGFGLVLFRLLRSSQLARDPFGRLLTAGIFAFIGFSVFQNAGMTMGIMPITGIPLPFLSYGGSAAVVFFMGIGVCLSVYWRRAR